MTSILRDTLPSEEFIVHASSHNEKFKTFDGVKLGSYRVYLELLDYLEKHPSVTHISIVGYSMGGLYARCMVGLMESTGLFERLIPVNFATFATPHLGATLWGRGLMTSIYNGLGRLLLGPSGFDLMSRGPHGILDQLVEPNSDYIKGLKRFRNLFLFSNAVGDRTVKFWTSFITNKTPFHKTHKYECDLVFFTYNSDPYGPVFLDMDRTKYKDIPETPEPTESVIAIYVWLVPVVIASLTMSTVSWLQLPFLLPYYKREVSRRARSLLAENYRDLETNEDRDSTSIAHNLKEQAQAIVEEVLPEEDAVLVGSVSTSTPPVPCKSGKFLDTSKYEIDFPGPIRQRMTVLNSLPWQKYVVYGRGQMHATIIDRHKEGPNKGTEVLRFFADLVKGENA